MPSVDVNIIRVIHQDYPIFVEFALTDADGKTHLFHDKLPIIDKDPRPGDYDPTGKQGELPCTLVTQKDGQILIDTALPASVASTEDLTRFWVTEDQVDLA